MTDSNARAHYATPTLVDRVRDYSPIVVLVVLFTGLVVPPIPLGYHGTHQAVDMRDNYLPQMNTFITHPLSLIDYRATAAQTPGHHIFLAWIGRLSGYDKIEEDNLVVRFANAVFGYLVILGPILAILVVARSTPKVPGRYSFDVRLFHPLLWAGLSQRIKRSVSPRVPQSILYRAQNWF